MNNRLIEFIIICLFISSCKEKKDNIDNRIAAIVERDTIFLDDIDERIKQQLYLQLDQVFQMRKLATNYMIDEKIIELEARQQKINVDSLLNQYYKKQTSDSSLHSYIISHHLENGLHDLRTDIKRVNVNSKLGQQLLIDSYQKFLKKELIRKLKTKFTYKISLLPPPQPKIDLTDLIVHYRGNLDSKVTVLIVSDFECDNCRILEPRYDSLYIKYKDKVRFGFTHYSSYVSMSAMASEAAAKSGKFWQMHDLIFSTKTNTRDTTNLLALCEDIGLNKQVVLNGLNDLSVYSSIKKNIELLHTFGIFGTPTVIINKRIIIHGNSQDEIENAINEELIIN